MHFRIESKKKNIAMEFQFDIKPEKGIIFYFKTDPEKVKLALANLISNAIKFSYEDNKIIIKDMERR